MGKWMKWKIVSILMLFGFASLNTGFLIQISAAEDKLFSLTAAIEAAKSYSSSIAEQKMKVKQKEIELTQARHAVVDQKRKDAGLFAKPHSLSEDVRLAMKIPEAEQALREAKLELERLNRVLASEIETAYGQVYQAMLSVKQMEDQLEQQQKALENMKTRAKFGLADAKMIEEEQAKVDEDASALKTARLRYQESKLTLTQKTGKDLESGFRFELKMDYANLNQDQLWRWIDHALQTDPAMDKKVQTRKLLELKRDTIRDLYTSKFKYSRVEPIESLFASNQAESDDLFLAKHDLMLDRVDHQWDGWILIPFPIIGVLPLPLNLFQGEYDGTRYFDDQKYMLPTVLMEWKQARQQEEETRKQLILKIKQSYLAAKQSEEEYVQAIKQEKESEKTQKQQQLKFDYGLITAGELEEKKKAVETATQQRISAYLAYQSAIGKLNTDTSGALEGLRQPGILPTDGIEDGLSSLAGSSSTDSGEVGKWELESGAEGLLGKLRLSLDASLGITDIVVTSASLQIIDKRVKVGEPIQHLSVVFQDLSQLRFHVYKQQKWIASGRLTGSGKKGSLVIDESRTSAPKLIPANGAGQENGQLKDLGFVKIGTYLIHRNALASESVKAAMATHPDSQFPVYYRSEFANGAWFQISKALSLQDISKTSSPTHEKEQTVQKYPAQVQIHATNQLTTPLTADQVSVVIAQLEDKRLNLEKKQDEQAEANAEAGASVEQSELLAATSLLTDVEQVKASIRLMEALKEADSAAAAEELALIGDRTAVRESLQEQANAQLADQQEELKQQLEQATQEQDTEKIAQLTDQISELQSMQTQSEPASSQIEQQLRATATQMGNELQQQIEDGQIGSTEIVNMAEQWTEQWLELAPYSAGIVESLDEVALILDQLQSALDEAKLSGDTAEVVELTALTDSFRQNQDEGMKLQTFEWMDLLESELAAWQESNINETDPIVKAGMESVIEHLQDQIIAGWVDVKLLEKKKYDEAELQNIKETGKDILETYKLQPLVVETLISRETIYYDSPPFIRGNEVYVQIRPLAEQFGWTVMWMDQGNTVLFSKDNAFIAIEINKKQMYRNGQTVELRHTPMLVFQRSYVPISFARDQLGLEISQREDNRFIEINGDS
ncbi:stalk domain-containing protein [Marinicrinis sediminis]|uniref:Stalk domain-containing protein n=1 Tax=Marinicrinis sediminis TaxID=1652465 RepID=A0ABW5RDQ2_9BACL